MQFVFLPGAGKKNSWIKTFFSILVWFCFGSLLFISSLLNFEDARGCQIKPSCRQKLKSQKKIEIGLKDEVSLDVEQL